VVGRRDYIGMSSDQPTQERRVTFRAQDGAHCNLPALLLVNVHGSETSYRLIV
jgi:hypothetical protein